MKVPDLSLYPRIVRVIAVIHVALVDQGAAQAGRGRDGPAQNPRQQIADHKLPEKLSKIASTYIICLFQHRVVAH